MKGLKLASFGVACLVMAGCVTAPKSIDNRGNFWQGIENKTVAVASNTLPEPGLHKMGSQGLLDLAIAAAVTSPVSDRLKQADLKPIQQTISDVAKGLTARGAEVKQIGPIDLNALPKSGGKANVQTAKDFSSLRSRHNADYLYLLQVNTLGSARAYYGFIPMSDPTGLTNATAQLVDLRNNNIVWQLPIHTEVAAWGEWNQKPEYPNLMKAFQQAMDLTREKAVDEFLQVR
ncbi:MAG: hypothetical protein OXT49_03170 [Gammaproteobacteria bacterium]|nr:hypothetical protein [Gammaproteobacteria bacterium]